MITTSVEEIGRRADTLAAALTAAGFRANVIDGESAIGGGSAPGTALATRLVQLEHPSLSPSELEKRLRELEPPIVVRILSDRVVLDLRTVFPQQDQMLLTH